MVVGVGHGVGRGRAVGVAVDGPFRVEPAVCGALRGGRAVGLQRPVHRFVSPGHRDMVPAPALLVQHLQIVRRAGGQIHGFGFLGRGSVERLRVGPARHIGAPRLVQAGGGRRDPEFRGVVRGDPESPFPGPWRDRAATQPLPVVVAAGSEGKRRRLLPPRDVGRFREVGVRGQRRHRRSGDPGPDVAPHQPRVAPGGQRVAPGQPFLVVGQPVLVPVRAAAVGRIERSVVAGIQARPVLPRIKEPVVVQVQGVGRVGGQDYYFPALDNHKARHDLGRGGVLQPVDVRAGPSDRQVVQAVGFLHQDLDVEGVPLGQGHHRPGLGGCRGPGPVSRVSVHPRRQPPREFRGGRVGGPRDHRPQP